MPSLKAYSQDLPYSYAPGVFPSTQLMRYRPQAASRLLLSEQAQGEGVEQLRSLCREAGVREEFAGKALSRISGKQNCFAAVVFEKWQSCLNPERPHVVLHHPMDEGNLGTIQRTLLGLGIEDLALITPCADVFSPHVVRASMGAVFSMRVCCYSDFSLYREEFPRHELFPFMLDGSIPPEQAAAAAHLPYTLIFGNEGAGLPPEFARLGQPVRIPHNHKIDSLNLAIAAAIGSYIFVNQARQQVDSR